MLVLIRGLERRCQEREEQRREADRKKHYPFETRPWRGDRHVGIRMVPERRSLAAHARRSVEY
ncbi:hypothetical protein [Sphingobium yanoikuyae]|uniref:hypothetical protein n=1 Tax=Sphingobium yanoikuyae TaxID=13690 RepID=UPI00242C5E90|nr:hypothetical protein [Sphingobium yanoikuyae]